METATLRSLQCSVLTLLYATAITCGIGCLAASAHTDPQPAFDPMTTYRQALEARSDKPHRFLQLSQQLIGWAPLNPGLRFLYAEALAKNGQTAPSSAELRSLADRGYYYPFWERPAFDKLRPASELDAIRNVMQQNAQTLGTIERTISTDVAGLVAEGIDAAADSWLLGSLADGSVYRMERSGVTKLLWRETAKARQALGLRYDTNKNVVWVCSNSSDDSNASAELLRISLESLEAERHRLPDPRSLCNDVVLLPAGAVAVSDSEGGAVWMLSADGGWSSLIQSGALGYPNGLTYLAASQRLLVADLRGLWSVDLTGGQMSAVVAPDGAFVGGIDGLYSAGRDLIAIQNGVNPRRILRIHLDDSPLRIKDVSSIASNVSALLEMTTAVVRGNEIAVLSSANAGQDAKATEQRAHVIQIIAP